MGIQASIFQGGDGEIITAVADTSLSSSTVGDKVILNYGYFSDTSITGMDGTSSSSNLPIGVVGQYMFGGGTSSSSTYNTYIISDESNTVTSVGKKPQTSALSAGYTWSYNSNQSHTILSAYSVSILLTTTGDLTSLSGTLYSASDTYLTYGTGSADTLTITKILSDGTTQTVSTSYAGNIVRVATDEGIVCFGNVMKLLSINNEGSLIETNLIDSSAVSFQSSSYPKNKIGNSIFINSQLTSITQASQLYFYKLTKNSSNSYTLTATTLPSEVSSQLTDYVTAIGNLQNNKFYISTSTNGSGADAKLHIISFDGDDLSTAIIDKTIVGVTTNPNNYLRMSLSYTEKYLLQQTTSNSDFHPNLTRLTSLNDWYAAIYNGVNFVNRSLTGFITNINNNNTVDVATVLPPEANLTISTPNDLTVNIMRIK